MIPSPLDRSHGSFFLQMMFCALLALAVIVVYAQVRNFNFVNLDDDVYIYSNVHVRSGFNWSNITWTFTHFQACYWIPVTFLSHILDCQFFGLNAGWHHLVNVALHLLNTGLLFLLLAWATQRPMRSAMVAALFALHPLHVESVVWLAERKDVLSTFFCFLALLAYFRYTQSNKNRSYYIVIAVFCLGLMSKPMLVTFPIILFLMDLWPFRRLSAEVIKFTSLTTFREFIRTHRRLLLEKVPFFILAFIFGLLTLWTTRSAMPSTETIPPLERLANAGRAYAWYLGKTFWPSNLSVFYPYFIELPWWITAFSVLLIILLTVTAVMLWKRYPPFFVGWAWFMVTLFPVIGLIQVGAQATADRFSYLSMIGLLIVVVWGLSDLFKGKQFGRIILTATAVLSLIACSLLSYWQLSYWRDSLNLFEHTIAVSKSNFLAHHNLAVAYCQAGKTDKGIEHFSAAIAINPSYCLAYSNLGITLFNNGQKEKGMQYLQQAIKMNPANVKALKNLGLAFMNNGQMEAATREYEMALRSDPDNWDTSYVLGKMYRARGDNQTALGHFSTAVKINPASDMAWLDLAKTQSLLGFNEAALNDAAKAVQINPKNFEARYLLGTQASIQGNLNQAAEHLRVAVSLMPGDDEAHNSLGVVLVRQRNFAEAIDHFQQALKINPTNSNASNNLQRALAQRKK